MTKHFPGGGPQQDGEDPHFAYGREQVYPGGQFELHLKPFEAAFEAGTRQIMPYYGMPVGTEYEEVGFGFNKSVITGLLRERYGFDGIVCTDWGLINDAAIFGQPFPARAWGVEHLTPRERMLKVIEAGVDQFGGEACPELLVELVADGSIAEERIDVSAAGCCARSSSSACSRIPSWTRMPRTRSSGARSSVPPARLRSALPSPCSRT